MPDALMEAIDDGLTSGDELLFGLVEVENQPRACCGGVMSSPQEQNTTMGDLMFRKSARMPSSVWSSPEVSLFPTKS